MNKRGITYEIECKLRAPLSKQKQNDAFFIMDLDLFKDINDTLGHQVGDLALQRVADVLRNVFNAEDNIGRFGGDEFVVYTQHVMNRQEIFHAAARIRVKMYGILSDYKVPQTTVSIGVAMRPDDGTTYDELFKMADRSLYKVKQAGGNGICVSDGAVLNSSVRFKNGRARRKNKLTSDDSANDGQRK